jgi:hypothetical protein
MIRRIVIEAEPPDDARSMFRLSVDATLIARSVTAAQAYFLLGEVLGRMAIPEHIEMLTFSADAEREGMWTAQAEAKTFRG